MLSDKKLSIDLYEKMLDNTSNAVGLCDKEGKIFYANNAFIEMFGYDNKEELINKSPLDCHPIDEIKKHGITMKKILKTNNLKKELKAIKKNGEEFYVEMTANVLKDDSGQPYCIMACFEEITKEKNIKQIYKSHKKTSNFFLIIFLKQLFQQIIKALL